MGNWTIKLSKQNGRLFHKPVSQSCAVAKSETFWWATGQSNSVSQIAISETFHKQLPKLVVKGGCLREVPLYKSRFVNMKYSSLVEFWQLCVLHFDFDSNNASWEISWNARWPWKDAVHATAIRGEVSCESCHIWPHLGKWHKYGTQYVKVLLSPESFSF